MNLVHISILAGIATISIPLLLHMLGKRQPKLVDFPALRFVRQTQQDHSKSWRLRHFLLLLLRVLLFAILALALARPRVHSAAMGSMIGISGLIIFAIIASLAAAIAWASKRPKAVWMSAAVVAIALWVGSAVWGYRSISQGPALPTSDTTAPVAVGIILDTSPSMNYVAANQSRLQAAKDMASWILNRMPSDSHVGVFTGVPIGSLAQSPQGAITQLGRINQTTGRVDLLERLRVALDLVLDDPLERREIYILTDMNSASWGSSKAELMQQIQEVKDQVLIQIVDVSSASLTNWQLGDPKVDFNTIPADGDANIRIAVTQKSNNLQTANAVTVELWKEEIDPKLPVISSGKLQLPESKVVARQVVNFTSDGTVEVELSAKRLTEGIHHFTIKLDRNDPLQIDNQRFVTITAKRQQPTLIVSSNTTVGLALQLLLSPSSATDQANSVQIANVNYGQLAQAALTKYSVIVLFDPAPLPAASVQALKEHVMGGGGLMIILGRSMESAAVPIDNSPFLELLPGINPKIATRPMSDRQSFWNPTAITHPVYQDLEVAPTSIAWQLLPIYRNWSFAALRENTQILATLSSDNSALLTAQTVGQGQILTLMTPLPEFEQNNGQLWNEMWISEQSWASFALLSGCLKSLSGANQLPLTYVAGATVTLPNDAVQWPKNWELYTPLAERRAVEASAGLLPTGSHSDVGVYHLRANRGGAVTRGFSINIEAADTLLERIEPEALNNLLGAGNYHVARRQEEIESSVGQARFGSELYPLLMLFVAGIFLAEQVMSNRFYSIQLRVGKAAA